MLFIFPTPQYPRRPLEYVFKALYLLASMAHVIALVVLIADFYTRLENSMPEYYTNKKLVVSQSIQLLMENCTYVGQIRLGSVVGSVEVTSGNISYGLMTTAQYVTGLFVLEFLLLANNAVSAMNYSTGNRHLRIFGIHVPFYHITVMMTYLYCIAIIVLTWCFNDNRKFYKKALEYCEQQLATQNKSNLLNSGYDGYSIFSTSVFWPFASTCFSLIIYLAAAAVLCWKSSDRAAVLLSEADAPWESRGLACATSKPLLKLHTAQRNAIVEDATKAIKEGLKVRIVRSYQLMTEEDFTALVQAMREQVAQAIKEKQFEKMKENLGDRDSQIDEMGFMWRQDLAARPQDGDNADNGSVVDQFLNVPFEDYFTDNEVHEYMPDGQDVMTGQRQEIIYSDEPLTIQEDGDEEMYDADNFDGNDLYDDGEGGNDGWSPQEGAASSYQQRRSTGNRDPLNRRQRHHRRRHHRDPLDEAPDAEPEARRPARRDDVGGSGGRRHSTNSGRRGEGGGAVPEDMNYFDGTADEFAGDRQSFRSEEAYSRSTGRSGAGAQRRPRHNRGRQAGVDQEVVEADELSGEQF